MSVVANTPGRCRGLVTLSLSPSGRNHCLVYERLTPPSGGGGSGGGALPAAKEDLVYVFYSSEHRLAN